MKIVRQHQHLESEARWRNGRQWLARSQNNHGFWEQEGLSVNHGSLGSRSINEPLPSWLLELGSQLSTTKKFGFDSARIAILLQVRNVKCGEEKIQTAKINFLYLSIGSKLETWTLALPFNETQDSIKKKILNWAKEIQQERALPIAPSELIIDQVVLAPAALGYLLHECLGHRLESDDQHTKIKWRSPWKALPFDVMDTGGRKDWLGYTPFDDLGVKSKEVRLLCGKTGKQEWLCEKSGNARAATTNHHTLIRQRCLEVRMIKNLKINPTSKMKTLHIEDLSSGAFLDGNTELTTSRQKWVDSSGKVYRVPRLVLNLNHEIVRHLKLFGKSQVFHPPAGCGKQNQNQLPISFSTPAAWFALRDLSEIFQISTLD